MSSVVMLTRQESRKIVCGVTPVVFTPSQSHSIISFVSLNICRCLFCARLTILNTKIPKSMASSSGSWTLAGGKKNKHQNSQSMSKTKKKAVIENMPRIEPNREFLNMLSQAVMLISKRRQADQRCRHRRWLWPVVTMRAFNCL